MNDIFIYDKRKGEIGKRIKDERKRLKLTQDELAARVSTAEGNHDPIGQSTVSSWEKGATLPPIGRLIILAYIFDCDIAYLLGDIKSRKWEHTDISQYTGLTFAAISMLHKAYQQGGTHFPAIQLISLIAEDIDFAGISREIFEITELYHRAAYAANLDDTGEFGYTKDGRVMLPVKETMNYKKEQVIRMLNEKIRREIDLVVANVFFSLYEDEIKKTAPGAANTRDG